ncbi:hypothetical protein NLI96_g836 [Meripilus lineatus]|uniref:BZIP domain-containing protein n=1 Tax=Meripilus lineatus TaxID=2056292 RepID=A0AAD5VBK8_9APHY|nr:hypothetical protein NLI96_g836 [Physisporinus lineatus]
MAPSNLQGLNIVHPPQPQNPYLSDQDLLSVPPFPDLSAQLDLWTNLNFQSDEPLISSRDDTSKGSVFDEKGKGLREGKEVDYNGPEDEAQDIGKVAETHAHENVVTGTVIPSPQLHGGNTAGQPLLNLSGLPMQPPLDIANLLAGFGIDPFQSHVPPPQSSTAPTLAQLLNFHAATLKPPSQTESSPSPPSPTSTETPSSTAATPPAPKRARTSRASASAEQIPTSPLSGVDEPLDTYTPLTAAEDKRRRNTAASARFRLKKKEREAALEKKAKELEVRVGELEKECEALRRENGWLKGLVVGVTGAGAVQQQQQQQVGNKRSRDDGDKSA